VLQQLEGGSEPNALTSVGVASSTEVKGNSTQNTLTIYILHNLLASLLDNLFTLSTAGGKGVFT
jgi:hypothetical protein